MKLVKDKFIIVRVTREEKEEFQKRAGGSESKLARRLLGLDD